AIRGANALLALVTEIVHVDTAGRERPHRLPHRSRPCDVWGVLRWILPARDRDAIEGGIPVGVSRGIARYPGNRAASLLQTDDRHRRGHLRESIEQRADGRVGEARQKVRLPVEAPASREEPIC